MRADAWNHISHRTSANAVQISYLSVYAIHPALAHNITVILQMTSKAINDIKKFSAADRSEWLDIKKNDTNYANKRKAGVEGYKAMKKKQKQRND